MKKIMFLIFAVPFAFMLGPPAMANATAKIGMNEEFTAPIAIETSSYDISLICTEMFYQADSPKSYSTFNGNSGNIILYADANVSGDKPDDAWLMREMANINYNLKAIANRSINYRFNSAPTYNFNSARMPARDYSMLGYNKRC